MNRSHFEQSFPGELFLAIDDVDALQNYLRDHEVIERHVRVVSLALAGEGNMNCVLRVKTENQSFIVKQSRPWVEKYPSIEAPRDRVIGEARFYDATASTRCLGLRMPRMLFCDEKACVMVLEDLGETRDYTSVYSEEVQISDETIVALCEWLSALHRVNVSPNDFANMDMRRLNHEHIFAFPLNLENGLPLDQFTPGLAQVAKQIQGNADFVTTTTRLGEIYLGFRPSQIDCLLHGDFFPGSWLDTNDGIRVIDPEFAFCGPPEFDVGVLTAHLHLSSQPPHTVELVNKCYAPRDGFDWHLSNQFAGVEIMRRLIGIAQLPLKATLETKQRLLKLSAQLVMGTHYLRTNNQT